MGAPFEVGGMFGHPKTEPKQKQVSELIKALRK